MIEKLIVLEDIDPVIFYGVNNANMQLIKALYPKLRIVARGNVIKVLGDEEEMCAFEENITKLEKYLSLIHICNGCFKPTVSSLVGQLYEPGDKRLDSAYTIFYMGVNVG